MGIPSPKRYSTLLKKALYYRHRFDSFYFFTPALKGENKNCQISLSQGNPLFIASPKRIPNQHPSARAIPVHALPVYPRMDPG